MGSYVISFIIHRHIMQLIIFFFVCAFNCLFLKMSIIDNTHFYVICYDIQLCRWFKHIYWIEQQA